MNELIIFMTIRGILALSLIFGGVYALRKGFQLYINASGLAEEGFKIQKGVDAPMNISLQRVGSVVMLTSCAWAYLAYLVMPKHILMNTNNTSGTINAYTNNTSGTSTIESTSPHVRIKHPHFDSTNVRSYNSQSDIQSINKTPLNIKSAPRL